MTLDEIIAAANDMGLCVSNLFEREDGRWQANVRERRANQKGDRHYEFAIEDTPWNALIQAVNIAVERRQ